MILSFEKNSIVLGFYLLKIKKQEKKSINQVRCIP